MIDPIPGKILPWFALLPQLAVRRARGEKIAFTNGCFDVLHIGHVRCLVEARQQADCLVVAINSDASVRQLKGPTRPVNSAEDRAAILTALYAVDYVVVFYDPTPIVLIEQMRPDVLVKSAQYAKADVVGAEFVESYGGRVHLAEHCAGHSTTETLRKLAAVESCARRSTDPVH